MHVEDWVDGYRPFTWATEQNTPTPTPETMGRLIARAPTRRCVIEPVAYKWFDSMRTLTTLSNDNFLARPDEYNTAVNTLWRGIHASTDAIDTLCLSALDAHQQSCDDEAFVTARRLLAALPSLPEEKQAGRVAHGAMVAAEAHHTAREEETIANNLDCMMLEDYTKESVEELDRLPQYTYDTILNAANAAPATTLPELIVKEK